MRSQNLFSFPNQSTNYQTNGPFPFQIKPQTTQPMCPFPSKSNHKLPNPCALSLPNQTTKYPTMGPFPSKSNHKLPNPWVLSLPNQTTNYPTHGPFPFQIKPQTTQPMGPFPSNQTTNYLLTHLSKSIINSLPMRKFQD
jgi:hypothetical protein